MSAIDLASAAGKRAARQAAVAVSLSVIVVQMLADAVGAFISGEG